MEEKYMKLEEMYGRPPDLHIGKEPWWIGFVGVDRATGEAVTEITEKPDMTNAQRRCDDFMRAFGFERCGSLSTM